MLTGDLPLKTCRAWGRHSDFLLSPPVLIAHIDQPSSIAYN
uniref:Uncharacterized protein n=1 Tax=Anguilla anguilla TaxID=7936 RepID=A0A0E9QR80_ANGAN